MCTERKDKKKIIKYENRKNNPLAQIQKICDLHIGTTSSPITKNRPTPNETTFYIYSVNKLLWTRSDAIFSIILFTLTCNFYFVYKFQFNFIFHFLVGVVMFIVSGHCLKKKKNIIMFVL